MGQRIYAPLLPQMLCFGMFCVPPDKSMVMSFPGLCLPHGHCAHPIPHLSLSASGEVRTSTLQALGDPLKPFHTTAIIWQLTISLRGHLVPPETLTDTDRFCFPQSFPGPLSIYDISLT